MSYPPKQTTDREMNKEFYARFKAPPEIETWHNEGFQIADAYDRNEYRLVELLSFMSKHKGYLFYKCESLTQYARFVWVLPENVIRDLVTVAKKSVEIPEMLEALKRGHSTVSKLRKVCPVITQENARDWIRLTEECTSREVERAVATEKPEEGFQDQVRFISGDTFEMRSAIRAIVMEKLQRTADLLSTQKKRPLTNDEVLDIMTEIVLDKIDPIRQAERAEKRAARKQNTQPNSKKAEEKATKPINDLSSPEALVPERVQPEDLAASSQARGAQIADGLKHII